jgi:hypothetical protein
MSEDQKSTSSWWQTVPGILTATASVILALATLLGALRQSGVLTSSKDEDKKANSVSAVDAKTDKQRGHQTSSAAQSFVTQEFKFGESGGTPGTQSSPQLDHEVDFKTAGELRMEFRLVRGACSQIMLRAYVDGNLVKKTSFFDETTGILDLGRFSSGPHTLKLSPEGRSGGCNTGQLQSWGGTLQVITSS